MEIGTTMLDRESSMGSPKRRVFHSLDAIRGVAAISVMMWHAEVLLGWRPQSGYLAVDLFFVLSGVVIAHSYDSKFDHGLSKIRFMMIRVIRLYPLYVLSMLISMTGVIVAMKMHVSINWTVRKLISSFCLSLFFLPTPDSLGSNGSIFPLNTPAWSLFFEVLVNILFAGTFLILRRRAMWLPVLLAAVVLVVIGLNRGSLNSGFLVVNWFDGIPRVIYSFGMGVIILRCRRLPFAVPGWIAAVLVVLLLAMPIPAEMRPIYDLVVVLSVFPALVAMTLDSTTRAPSLCNLLGNLSYPVYVLHSPVLAIYSSALVKVVRLPQVRLAPSAGIAFLLFMIVFALIVDRLYDVPVRRWLSRKIVHRTTPIVA